MEIPTLPCEEVISLIIRIIAEQTDNQISLTPNEGGDEEMRPRTDHESVRTYDVKNFQSFIASTSPSDLHK
ncbi:12004_t:CDS:2, partial [Entrophospora sp. SA101]